MLFGGGLIPTYLVMTKLGLYNNIWAIIIPGAVNIWNIILCHTYFRSIPEDMREAAKIDGANWWQRFLAITLPAIKPEIFVVALTCTIAALKVFGPVYMLTKGGPGTSTIVPSYYSYVQFFQSQQVGYGATIATALTVVIIVVAVIFTNLQEKVAKEDEE